MTTPKSWLILALSGATVLGAGGVQLVRYLRSRKATAALPDASGGLVYLGSEQPMDELWIHPEDQPSSRESMGFTGKGHTAYAAPSSEHAIVDPWAGQETVAASETGEDFFPFSPRPREDDLSDWYLPANRARLDEGVAFPGDFLLGEDPELRVIGKQLWQLAFPQLPEEESEEATIHSDRHTYSVRRLNASEGQVYIHLRRQPKDF